MESRISDAVVDLVRTHESTLQGIALPELFTRLLKRHEESKDFLRQRFGRRGVEGLATFIKFRLGRDLEMFDAICGVRVRLRATSPPQKSEGAAPCHVAPADATSTGPGRQEKEETRNTAPARTYAAAARECTSPPQQHDAASTRRKEEKAGRKKAQALTKAAAAREKAEDDLWKADQRRIRREEKAAAAAVAAAAEQKNEQRCAEEEQRRKEHVIQDPEPFPGATSECPASHIALDMYVRGSFAEAPPDVVKSRRIIKARRTTAGKASKQPRPAGTWSAHAHQRLTGARVRIRGLVSAVQYNGLSATVKRLLPDGRVCVVLDAPNNAASGKEISIKASQAFLSEEEADEDEDETRLQSSRSMVGSLESSDDEEDRRALEATLQVSSEQIGSSAAARMTLMHLTDKVKAEARKEVNKLPAYNKGDPVDQEGQDGDSFCPFCHEPIVELAEASKAIGKLPCSHVACRACLNDWVDKVDLVKQKNAYHLHLSCILCTKWFIDETSTTFRALFEHPVFKRHVANVEEEVIEDEGEVEDEQQEIVEGSRVRIQCLQRRPKAEGQAGQRADDPHGGDGAPTRLQNMPAGEQMLGQLQQQQHEQPFEAILRFLHGASGTVTAWDSQSTRFHVRLDRPLGGGRGVWVGVSITEVAIMPENLVALTSGHPAGKGGGNGKRSGGNNTGGRREVREQGPREEDAKEAMQKLLGVGDEYASQNQHADALQSYRQALKLAIKGREEEAKATNDNSCADWVALLYSRMGDVHANQGANDAALEAYNQALDNKIEQDKDAGDYMYNKACVLEMQGKMEEAQRLFDRSTQIYGQEFGFDHHETLDAARKAADAAKKAAGEVQLPLSCGEKYGWDEEAHREQTDYQQMEQTLSFTPAAQHGPLPNAHDTTLPDAGCNRPQEQEELDECVGEERLYELAQVAKRVMKLGSPDLAYPVARKGLEEVGGIERASDSVRGVSLARNVTAKCALTIAQQHLEAYKVATTSSLEPNWNKGKEAASSALEFATNSAASFDSQLSDTYLARNHQEELRKVCDSRELAVRLREDAKAALLQAEAEANKADEARDKERLMLEEQTLCRLVNAGSPSPAQPLQELSQSMILGGCGPDDEEDAFRAVQQVREYEQRSGSTLTCLKQALKEGHWKLKRNNKHALYTREVIKLLESGERKHETQNFTKPNTPSDSRAWANALADLRRMNDAVIHIFEGGLSDAPKGCSAAAEWAELKDRVKQKQDQIDCLKRLGFVSPEELSRHQFQLAQYESELFGFEYPGAW